MYHHVSYQNLLPNFINPETPYKGLIIMHGLGSGKTQTGINIADNFIPQCQKYRTKIVVLVPGPLLKEIWKNAFTYLFLFGILEIQGENAKISKNFIFIQFSMKNLKFFRSKFSKIFDLKIFHFHTNSNENFRKNRKFFDLKKSHFFRKVTLTFFIFKNFRSFFL